MARSLQDFLYSTPPSHPCFVGFDGFIDHIMTLVSERRSALDWSTLPSIASFAQRIEQAQGKSTNLEMLQKQEKIGGNAPILSHGLIQAGHAVTLCATLGEKENLHPSFHTVTSSCKNFFNLGPCGESHCLEFLDGKIILGQLRSVNSLNWDTIKTIVSTERLIEVLASCRLLAMVNWTMIPGMSDIWRGMLEEVVPQLTESTPPRWLFVDLADPAKRSDEDLEDALLLLAQWSRHFRVALGLNFSEALRVCKVLGIDFKALDPDSTASTAAKLQATLGFHEVVLHSPFLAAAANSAHHTSLATQHQAQPKLCTGAGDNFNAGYCSGLLWGRNLLERLQLACATATYYVSHGDSPTPDELANFLSQQSSLPS